jgi:hypothetical protein
VWATHWEQASREIDAEEAESRPGTTAGAEKGSAKKIRPSAASQDENPLKVRERQSAREASNLNDCAFASG